VTNESAPSSTHRPRPNASAEPAGVEVGAWEEADGRRGTARHSCTRAARSAKPGALNPAPPSSPPRTPAAHLNLC
jgi:hypothetical protein